ncbi:MAG: hypothetical protein HFG41_11735 [Coprococcus sp.]|nr:hypothetical protein [Coprococcus sp.]
MERAIEENKKALEMDAKSSWTTKRILQTKEVWIIALSRGTQLLYAGGVMVQMILAFMGRGYELEKAVNLMLATAICAMVGSYLMGYVDNLLGTRRAIQITSLVQQHSGLVNLIAYSAMCFIKYISWGLWVVSC